MGLTICFGTPGWIRTNARWILSPLPLPLGYKGVTHFFRDNYKVHQVGLEPTITEL